MILVKVSSSYLFQFLVLEYLDLTIHTTPVPEPCGHKLRHKLDERHVRASTRATADSLKIESSF